MSDEIRLNLRLTGAAKTLIEEMATELGEKPRDVILDSLSLFHLAVDEVKRGNRLAIRDANGEVTALATTTLRHLAAKVSKKAGAT